eukprot:1027606-Pyramimonas_sp.AAC.1
MLEACRRRGSSGTWPVQLGANRRNVASGTCLCHFRHAGDMPHVAVGGCHMGHTNNTDGMPQV